MITFENNMYDQPIKTRQHPNSLNVGTLFHNVYYKDRIVWLSVHVMSACRWSACSTGLALAQRGWAQACTQRGPGIQAVNERS